jgi:hypothetical protein
MGNGLLIEWGEKGVFSVGIALGVDTESLDGSEYLDKLVGNGIAQSSEQDFDVVGSACSRAKTEKFCMSLTRDPGKKRFRGQMPCSAGSEDGI